MKITERWLPVKGFEDYEVSDLGRVRTLNYKRTGKVKVLSPQATKGGYLQVLLYKDGKKKRFYVHRLVVIAFIGDIPKGMVVNHLNEDKLDNRLSNLEVVTQKENINYGTRNERVAEAHSKQLDLIEADYPYREFTFKNSLKASEFFSYKSEGQIKGLICRARQRGENWINIRKKKYFFAQEA